MNKLVLSALAATVAVGTTSASESDWAGLDAELNSLTTALDSHGGAAIGGYVEAAYDLDADDNAFNGSRRWRVSASGSSGGYGYNVGTGSEDADANVTFTMGGMGWTMGQFMKPGTGADAEAENDRVFSTRDRGSSGTRSTGLMTSGNVDALGYSVFYGDGTTGQDLAARVTYDIMTGDGINLSVAYSTDESDDSSAIEVDVSSGPFSIHATQQDDAGDTMVITASYAVNDMWGVHIRDTSDDAGANDTMDWALVYSDAGARWTIESADGGAADDTITVGCTVGF